jgi:hypothetical protein
MKRACFVFYALSQGTLGAQNSQIHIEEFEGAQQLQGSRDPWDDHNTALYYLNETFQGAEGYSSPALERLKTLSQPNEPDEHLCKDILTILEKLHRVVHTNNPELRTWRGLEVVQSRTNGFLNRAFMVIAKMNSPHQMRILRRIKNHLSDRYTKTRKILHDQKTEMANVQQGEANHLDWLQLPEIPCSARSRSSSNVSAPGSIGSSLSSPSVASDRSENAVPGAAPITNLREEVKRITRGEEKIDEADIGNLPGPGSAGWSESPAGSVASVDGMKMLMPELDYSVGDMEDVGNNESSVPLESASFDDIQVDWNPEYVDITHESSSAQKGSDGLPPLPQADQVKILRGKAAGNRAQYKPGFSLAGKSFDYDKCEFNTDDF